MYTMIHNGNDVIAPTAHCYFSLPPRSGSFFSPLSLLYCVVVVVVVFVDVVVVVVMFKSLHLVEICTLTSAF